MYACRKISWHTSSASLPTILRHMARTHGAWSRMSSEKASLLRPCWNAFTS